MVVVVVVVIVAVVAVVAVFKLSTPPRHDFFARVFLFILVCRQLFL